MTPDFTLLALVAIVFLLVFLLLAPLLLSVITAVLMIPLIILGAVNYRLKRIVGYLRRWRSGGRIRP